MPDTADRQPERRGLVPVELAAGHVSAETINRVVQPGSGEAIPLGDGVFIPGLDESQPLVVSQFRDLQITEELEVDRRGDGPMYLAGVWSPSRDSAEGQVHAFAALRVRRRMLRGENYEVRIFAYRPG
jgi:hypothetical protein